jgi:ATP-grasp domain
VTQLAIGTSIRAYYHKHFTGAVFLTDRRPSALIVAAKWWPSSARLAIALIRNGCRVGAVYPAGHPLGFISGIEYIGRYRGIHSLSCLRRCISESLPDIIIPCDDGVVAQLHELHRQEPTMRDLIERSIGAPDGYSMVGSRFQLLNTAASLNIRVPRTVRVGGAQDLVDWHLNNASISVLKVDGESGGNGVRISRSLDESLTAWRELSARPTAAHAWKRLAIDRDPLATWMRSNLKGREVTIQEYIAGRPANSLLVCRDGAVISQAAALVVATDGPTGAATIIRPVIDRRMALAGELLAAKLRLSGFCGLDFMVETATGNPYLIEMNPRCTQLGHLELAGQGSLAAAWCADLKGEPPCGPLHPIRPGPIALFPQAFAGIAAQSPHLDSSYHDIPWEEPRLVHELMLEPWPIRRWGARLYHLFRPVSRHVPVEFEAAGPSINKQRHRAVS